MIRPEKFREYINDLWRWQRLTKKTKRLRLSVPQDLSFLSVFFFFHFPAQHLQSTLLGTPYPVKFMHGINHQWYFTGYILRQFSAPNLDGMDPRSLGYCN